MRRLETNYSTLVWSEDGSRLTKSRPSGSSYARSRFRNELRVNRLLGAHKPPVPTPALVAHDVQTRSLTFEALPGEPIGPKYPHDLTHTEIDAILAIGRDLAPYNPRRRWLRRIESARRLTLARNIGLLDARVTALLIDMADGRHRKLQFAHGDLTARNVLRCDNEVAVIDWEWAGLYPPGYDAAFFWCSLVDTDRGRARVEQSLDVDETTFLLSALLVQLWHLQWYVPTGFMKTHLATRDELIDRLCG